MGDFKTTKVQDSSGAIIDPAVEGGNLADIKTNTDRLVELAPAGTVLNTYSSRITDNTTTTPVASTAYISSIVISTEVIGTTSTIRVQDKSGTPLILINGVTTVVIGASPTGINFQTPIKMTGGIDIITAGAVAATVNVWINYYT